MSDFLAPNGEKSNLTPEQYKLVRTTAFKEWFGDWENSPETASKIVDDNGEPLPVYHGTSLKNRKDIEKFGFDSSKGRNGLLGFSFMSNIEYVKPYNKGSIIPVFLNIRQPMDYDFNFEIRTHILKGLGKTFKTMTSSDWIKHTEYISKEFMYISIKLGYDGIFQPNQPEISVFKNTNIKLADGSNTTFDSSKASILFENGGEARPFTDDGNKLVVFNQYRNYTPYKIAVDDINNAEYITLWKTDTDTGEDKKMGYLRLNNSGDDFLSVSETSIDKGSKGLGLGLLMYKVALKYSSDKIKGIKSYLPDRTNKKQIPKIYKKLNSVKDGDYEFIYKENNPDIRFNEGGSVLLAPNGEPSNLSPEQYKLVRTPAFKQWFGDWENNPSKASKVVDENGEPLHLYHYSNKNFNFFKTFSFFSEIKNSYRTNLLKNEYNVYLSIQNPLELRYNKLGKNKFFKVVKEIYEGVIFKKGRYKGQGFDEESIEFMMSNANEIKDSKGFYKLLSDFIGGYNWDWVVDYAKKKGFDGVFYNETNRDLTETFTGFLAFNPKQIKLADGTNTTFDGSNPDIRYAGGGEIESVIEQVKLEVDLSYYKQNIQYHSLYSKLKNLNFFDDDEKVTSILVKGFINDVKAKSELVNGKIRLYRALAIKNIEKLNVEKLGIYWSVNEDKTGVFDDEGYEHKEKPNYESVFIIRAEFNTKDIDWQNSFNLYVMNDWMEGEIRVVDGSEAYNLKIKKSGDKKWLNI